MQSDQAFQERQDRKVVVNVDSQHRVVKLYTNPGAPKVVRLLAAPGTGKTTTGCSLLQNMFLEQADPLYPNFLFLTFTKRTRIDLVRKIYDLKGHRFQRKQYVFNRIRNFHSLAYGLVFWNSVIEKKEEQKKFEYFLGQIYIPPQNQQRSSFEKNRITKLAWKTVHKFMAEALNEKQKEEEIQKLKMNPRNGPAINLIETYQNWLKQRFRTQRAVTYDSAICLAIDKIKAGRPCHNINLDEIDLIIVDEFQDSNPAQIRMLQSLMERTKKDVKLLMIGDFDQNIYLWRGAKYKVIQDFIDRYPWQPMFLEQSYRLSQSIKNISQKLIVSNPNYQQFRRNFYKNYNLKAMNRERDYPLQVREFDSEYSQVRWVVDRIYQHISKGWQPKDITVLCRNFTHNKFYEKFKIQMKRKSQITKIEVPFDFQNNGDSLGSEEGKYFLCLLKYFYEINQQKKPNADPGDIRRILQLKDVGEADDVRKRIIEKRRIDKQHNYYTKKQPKQQYRQASWRQFFIDFARIEALIFNKNHIRDTLEEIEHIILESRWLSNKFSENIIDEFIEAVVQIAQTIDPEEFKKEPTLSVVKKLVQDINFNSLLNNITEEGQEDNQQHQGRIPMRRRRDLALMRELEVRANRNRMSVQSMHNAKGLQYPIVFICALDFGYIQSDYEESEWKLQRLPDADFKRLQQAEREEIIEKQSEQLRLIYTAITRSSGYVYVCASKEDNYNSTQFPRFPEHKVFSKLKELCGVTQTIPFNMELDNPCKEAITREIQQQKTHKKKRQNRKRQKRNSKNSNPEKQ